jgi:hypothetical protein
MDAAASASSVEWLYPVYTNLAAVVVGVDLHASFSSVLDVDEQE